MGFIFSGVFYKARKPLIENSYKVNTMGFEGYMVDVPKDIQVLTCDNARTPFLVIHYNTWAGEVNWFSVTYLKGNYKSDISVRDHGFNRIPKSIIASIKKFGFTEYGNPMEDDPNTIDETFEPFTRGWNGRQVKA